MFPRLMVVSYFASRAATAAAKSLRNCLRFSFDIFMIISFNCDLNNSF